VLFTFGYCWVVGWGLLELIDKVIGLRVAEADEEVGLDLTEHHERAYSH